MSMTADTAAEATAAAPAFARRQVVEVVKHTGPRFTPDWSEKAVIIGAHSPKVMGGLTGWYVVRFADGGGLTIHASNMRASNRPAYRGRRIATLSTQEAA